MPPAPGVCVTWRAFPTRVRKPQPCPYAVWHGIRMWCLRESQSLRRKGGNMPEKETIERARQDKAEGKAPTTQAGGFIRAEMHHIRGGKHGARWTQEAIAYGLAK